jgi:hypothetical protein
MAFDFSDPPTLRRMWQTPCFEKLDALEWPYGFSVVCFGVRIGVRSNDADLLDKLHSMLPADARASRSKVVDHYFSAILGGREEGSRIRKMHLLYGNHDLVFRHRDLDPMFPAFESGFRLAVAALAPRRIFVHAGVVGWKGRAILIPGQSLAGKTTLVAELVRAGATYLSDEFAVLDSQGRVHPFRKPLSMRPERTAPQVSTAVEALGGRAAKRPLPVGLVALTNYKDGGRWRPRTLTPGRGMLEMLAHTTTAWYAPQRAMATLREVVAHAPVVKSSRGEAAEVAPLVLRHLERHIARQDGAGKGEVGGREARASAA